MKANARLKFIEYAALMGLGGILVQAAYLAPAGWVRSVAIIASSLVMLGLSYLLATRK